MIRRHVLPQYVRTHRKLMGLTQGEVAFLLRCDSRSMYASYETTQRLPNLEHALGLASVYGVDIEELFGGIYQRVAHDVAARAKDLICLLELQPQIWEVRQKIWRLRRLVERIEGSDNDRAA